MIDKEFSLIFEDTGRTLMGTLHLPSLFLILCPLYTEMNGLESIFNVSSTNLLVA